MANNSKVREAAKKAGVRFWELAAEMNVSESTITRRLRQPLSPEREFEFLDAISLIAKREKENV